MIEIEKPKITIDKLDDSGKYGKFIVEPLESGYGITTVSYTHLTLPTTF